MLKIVSGLPVPNGPTKSISFRVSGETSLKFNSKSKSLTSRLVVGLKLFFFFFRNYSNLSDLKDNPQAKS